MQDAKRNIPLRSRYRIAIAFTMSVFLACAVCAQDARWQQECETIFSAAVRAEQQHNPIEAELRYEECRELAQKHRLPKIEAAALHRLAVIRAQNKKFTESANMFRRALELDPRNAMILHDFAQLHADRKDFSEAEKLLKRALDVEPDNRRVLFSLGSIIVAQRAARQTEGLRYLKLAVGEAEAYWELARICRSNGDLPRAEFAERKAQEAVVASNNFAPDSQRLEHQPLTPPAVVARNRSELVNLEIREVIESQLHQTATSPIAQTPPASPSANPTFSRLISVTPIVPAATSPQQSSIPNDPLAPAVSQQRPAASIVRQLGSPGDTPPVPSTVRAIPSHPASPPVVQPSRIYAPFAPVATIPPPANSGEKKPQLLRVTSPTGSEPEASPAQPPSPGTPVRQINIPSIRVLPGGILSTEHTNSGNPLRRIPPSRGELIDPANGVSTIASLPSYSAVETRRILRTDQSSAPEHSGSGSAEVESRSSGLPSGASVARTSRPLPVRDVDVPPPPSAVIARGEPPGVRRITTDSASEENVYHHVANLRFERPSSTTSNSEPTLVISGDRHFASANAPAVLRFAATDNNQPPAAFSSSSAEVAARAVVPTAPAPMLADVRPRMSVPMDNVLGDPFPILYDTEPTPRPVAPADSPRLDGAKPSTPAPIVAAPADPPRLAEVRPSTPLPVVPADPPRLAEVRPTTPAPAVAEVKPTAPAPVVAEVRPTAPAPVVAEVKPTTPAPAVAEVRPATPTPVVAEVRPAAPAPIIAEVRPTAPAPVVAEVRPTTPAPVVAEVRPTAPAPVIAEVRPTTPAPVVAEVRPTAPAPVIA